MTYEQKNELRNECMRFLRFAYLTDFQNVNILKKIYNESVNELICSFRKILVDLQMPVTGIKTKK